MKEHPHKSPHSAKRADGQQDAMPAVADIPQEFSGDLLNNIRAGLLRVHSKHLDRVDLNECLQESYDVYAGLLQKAGWQLNETLLRESIPAWVLQWAVARKWWIYPPQRPRRNWPAHTSGRYISSHEPVPAEDLTMPFGSYMVTDWYKEDMMNRLGSRIAIWQAEALVPLAAMGTPPEPELRTNEDGGTRTVDGVGDHPPTLPDIEAALAANDRKKAVKLRCTLDRCRIKEFCTDAFKQRGGTDKTKRTALNRWRVSRPDTPSWANDLILKHLLR